MAATVEDLEVLEGQSVEEYESDESEVTTTVFDDLAESVVLLKRAMVLLDYVSDPALCKAISKRERGIMDNLSSDIADHVEDIENSYEDL